jgi:thymidylate kinase
VTSCIRSASPHAVAGVDVSKVGCVHARVFTIALIGPDGAGKTTIARELERALPRPAKYLYMGVNWEASDHLLPTTRLIRALRASRHEERAGGPPDPLRERSAAVPATTRVVRGVWTVLALGNRLAEEVHRVLLARRYVRRGTVVVFDRDFFSDYHAHDVAGGNARTIDRRVHGLFLSRIYPRPDLVVYLDAPADVLFARKGEGTIESLDRRRHDYLAVAAETRNFRSVNADRPLPDVVADVVDVVESFAAEHAARS